MGAKIPPTCSVEHVEAVFDVARGVGMNDVEQDRDTEAVSRIDKTLEVLGTSKPARGGEKGRHLITEGRGRREEGQEVVDEWRKSRQTAAI